MKRMQFRHIIDGQVKDHILIRATHSEWEAVPKSRTLAFSVLDDGYCIRAMVPMLPGVDTLADYAPADSLDAGGLRDGRVG